MSEQTTTTNQPDFVPVDLATLEGFDEPLNINPSVNLFSRQSPVPDAWYAAKLRKPKDTTERPFLVQGTVKKGENIGKKYLRINFDIELQAFADPSADNSVLKGKSRTFPGSASTLVFSRDGEVGSEVSSLCGLLGIGVDKTSTDRQMVEAIESLVAQNQADLKVRTEWRGQRKVTDPATGKETWTTVIYGQAGFPKDDDGHFIPVKEMPNGERINASARIAEYARL